MHELPINNLDLEEATRALTRCCGATKWVEAMLAKRPFASIESLYSSGEEIWWSLDGKDWLQAFAHHPKIGDLGSLRAKFSTTGQWAAKEQSGVNQAPEEVLKSLAQGNEDYLKKFGYIFIVCATGKSAGEMLGLLQQRLHNEPDVELRTAAGEQAKITRLRLEKLCQEVPSQPTF